MRLIIAATLAWLIAATGSAFAWDVAERRIIGFSPDRKWFAFEQFGVQDGSGFPYHDVFVVDTINDKWASGTPVRILLQDDTKSAFDARQAARAAAAPTLAKLKITDQGRIIASRPVTEAAGSPLSFEFAAYRSLGGAEYTHHLELEVFDLPSNANCQAMDPDTKGFALYLKAGTKPRVEVYRDTSLPGSRGCALDYGLSDVVIAAETSLDQGFVALIHLHTLGFEGSDIRYIAVPIQSP